MPAAQLQTEWIPAQFSVLVIMYLGFALVIGLLAARKNRNPWAWGLLGGLSYMIALAVLAFMPYLCPRCRRPLTNSEWKERRCPACGCLETAA